MKRWAAKALKQTALLGIPISAAAFFLGNPHSGPGGYFYLLGLIVLWPVNWLAAHTTLAWQHQADFWALSAALQLIWVFGFFVMFQFLFEALRKKRRA